MPYSDIEYQEQRERFYLAIVRDLKTGWLRQAQEDFKEPFSGKTQQRLLREMISKKKTSLLLFGLLSSLIAYIFINEWNLQLRKHNKALFTDIIFQDTTYVSKLYSKAGRLRETADFDSSNFYYRKASEIYKKEEDYEKYLTCLNWIGKNLWQQGQYNNAVNLLNPALETGISMFGENHLVVAETYQNLGVISSKIGEYDTALEYYSKTLSTRLTLLGENHNQTAMIYNNIGAIYYYKGNYEKAYEMHKKSLKIRRKLLGEYHKDIAMSYDNIGLIFRTKGLYEQALEYYEKALQIRLKVYSFDHPEIASSYFRIANIYLIRGDYEKSLEFYNHALNIRIKKLGDEHISVAMIYNNIGLVYQDMGNFSVALHYFQKKLSILHKQIGKNQKSIAYTYANMAELYFLTNDYKKSIDYYDKALSIFIEIYGPRHDSIGKIYKYLGKVYSKMGNQSKALSFFRRSLTINRKILPERHPEIAETFLEIGKTYFKNSDLHNSLDYINKAILSLVREPSDSSLLENPPIRNVIDDQLLIETLKTKAEVLFSIARKTLFIFQAHYKGDRRVFERIIHYATATINTYDLAIQLIDTLRSSYITENSKLFLGEKVFEVYEKAILSAFFLYDLTKKESCKHKAFQYSERSKSIVLLEALSESKAKIFARIPDSLLYKEKALKLDLAFYRRKLIEAYKSKPDSAMFLRWQNKWFTLNRSHEALIEKFENQFPEYYDLKYKIVPVTIRTLQDELLQREQTVIEYFTGDSSIFIFVISKDDFIVKHFRKERDLENEIRNLHNSLIKQDFNLYIHSAYTLYQILIAPLENFLKGENLIIVPDGMLSYIPFEVLLTHEPEVKELQYDKLPYMIKRHRIHYVNSCTLWSEMLNQTTKIIPEEIFIGFAPIFFHKQ